MYSLHIPPTASHVQGINNTLFSCSWASFKIFRSDSNVGDYNCLFGSTFQTAIVDLNSGDCFNNNIKNSIAVSAESGQRYFSQDNYLINNKKNTLRNKFSS